MIYFDETCDTSQETSKIRVRWKTFDRTISRDTVVPQQITMLRLIAQSCTRLRQKIADGTLSLPQLARDVDAMALAAERDETEVWGVFVSMLGAVTVLRAAGMAEGDDGVMILLPS
jgi:hypothetical protein